MPKGEKGTGREKLPPPPWQRKQHALPNGGMFSQAKWAARKQWCPLVLEQYFVLYQSCFCSLQQSDTATAFFFSASPNFSLLMFRMVSHCLLQSRIQKIQQYREAQWKDTFVV